MVFLVLTRGKYFMIYLFNTNDPRHPRTYQINQLYPFLLTSKTLNIPANSGQAFNIEPTNYLSPDSDILLQLITS